jgi:hypothetical protein
VTAERKEGEKLLVFYTNLSKSTDDDLYPLHDGTEHDGIEADDSSSDDSDFNDSDYEIGFFDDDMFADNVDAAMYDQGATTSGKMFK